MSPSQLINVVSDMPDVSKSINDIPGNVFFWVLSQVSNEDGTPE